VAFPHHARGLQARAEPRAREELVVRRERLDEPLVADTTSAAVRLLSWFAHPRCRNRTASLFELLCTKHYPAEYGSRRTTQRTDPDAPDGGALSDATAVRQRSA